MGVPFRKRPSPCTHARLGQSCIPAPRCSLPAHPWALLRSQAPPFLGQRGPDLSKFNSRLLTLPLPNSPGPQLQAKFPLVFPTQPPSSSSYAEKRGSEQTLPRPPTTFISSCFVRLCNTPSYSMSASLNPPLEPLGKLYPFQKASLKMFPASHPPLQVPASSCV